ncbi:MAG: HlyC/CorC family transporter [Peptostreptococcaceae bacterium]|nr:HlyC/CorC family transporter [Peptostreptococcaceae bacterium]
MSSDPSGLFIYVLVIISLILVYGIIVTSKRALDTVNKNIIDEMVSEGSDKAKKVDYFIERPSRYHYANKSFGIIINLINISIICTTILPMFNDNHVIIVPVTLAIAYLLMFQVLGEFLPKKLAAQDSEKYALKYSGFQQFVIWITIPFVSISLGITNLLLKLMKKKTDVDDTEFSEDSVMSMLDRGQKSGEIKEEGKKMINSIFAFDDMLAYEIMTPRTDVFTIDIEDPASEYIDKLMELRYSRVPVCENDNDNIIGVFHIKDYLIKARDSGFDNVNIRDILRTPYFVPETKNIDSLLVELQRQKQHIAILIDEYGGFSGIVSIEDIIEQIMGDIDDEYDEEDHVIEKIEDGIYLIDGNVDLDVLNKEIDIKLESENSETIGGFLIDILGEIPEEDNKYEPLYFKNYVFNIVSVKDRRIEKVKLLILSKDEDKED